MPGWKNERDERFNELLHRVLSEVLSEVENAPVLAAICDAGVPMWFMVVLTQVVRESKFKARIFLNPRSRLIAVIDAGDSMELLKQFGFRPTRHSFFGMDDRWIGPSDQPLNRPDMKTDALSQTLPTEHAVPPA